MFRIRKKVILSICFLVMTFNLSAQTKSKWIKVIYNWPHDLEGSLEGLDFKKLDYRYLFEVYFLNVNSDSIGNQQNLNNDSIKKYSNDSLNIKKGYNSYCFFPIYDSINIELSQNEILTKLISNTWLNTQTSLLHKFISEPVGVEKYFRPVSNPHNNRLYDYGETWQLYNILGDYFLYHRIHDESHFYQITGVTDSTINLIEYQEHGIRNITFKATLSDEYCDTKEKLVSHPWVVKDIAHFYGEKIKKKSLRIYCDNDSGSCFGLIIKDLTYRQLMRNKLIYNFQENGEYTIELRKTFTSKKKGISKGFWQISKDLRYVTLVNDFGASFHIKILDSDYKTLNLSQVFSIQYSKSNNMTCLIESIITLE